VVSTTGLTAAAVVNELRRCGVTDVVWLPDSESGHLYACLRDDAALRLVPVCREGEAIAIALGLMVGGRRPAVVMQNTGLFESGDSLRGLGLNLGLPLLLLISYRGYSGSLPPTDSAAVYLEPILRAWGLAYYLVESDADVGLIGTALAAAQAQQRPAVALMAREYGAP